MNTSLFLCKGAVGHWLHPITSSLTASRSWTGKRSPSDQHGHSEMQLHTMSRFFLKFLSQVHTCVIVDSDSEPGIVKCWGENDQNGVVSHLSKYCEISVMCKQCHFPNYRLAT
jgi:hypothetical protein